MGQRTSANRTKYPNNDKSWCQKDDDLLYELILRAIDESNGTTKLTRRLAAKWEGVFGRNAAAIGDRMYRIRKGEIKYDHWEFDFTPYAPKQKHAGDGDNRSKDQIELKLTEDGGRVFNIRLIIPNDPSVEPAISILS